MSYKSRVYRQRNAHTHDESQQEQFFSKQHDINRPSKTGTVQTKLSVNEPGDSYEKEADAVAQNVVNRSVKSPVVQQKEISSIQRETVPPEKEKKKVQEKRIQRETEPEKEKDKVQKMEQPEKEEDKMKNAGTVQKKTEPDKEKEKVQKKDEPKKEEEDKKGTTPVQRKEASTTTPDVAAHLDGSAGKGQALPPNTLQEMSSGFGVDFSKVRVHNDSEAVQLSNQLEAQAFTHGNDIYFNEGKFDPTSSSGKLLLAHELTHTVQQGASTDTKTTDAGSNNIAHAAPGSVQRSWTGDRTGWVSAAVNSGNWAGADPPGAYVILNGLATGDMVNVLRGLSAEQRKKLSDNLQEHGSGFDRPRIQAALANAAAS